jgi:hypothetical protein
MRPLFAGYLKFSKVESGKGSRIILKEKTTFDERWFPPLTKKTMKHLLNSNAFISAHRRLVNRRMSSTKKGPIGQVMFRYCSVDPLKLVPHRTTLITSRTVQHLVPLFAQLSKKIGSEKTLQGINPSRRMRC